MAAPGVPSGFYVQSANQTNYIFCALTATATSYRIQRSTDGVTYTDLTGATALTTPYYLDTAVTIGTQYFYQMCAHNVSGDSAFTTPQTAIPSLSGELPLSQLRLYAQQRADQVNSNFLTLPEWNANINNSYFELYDLLVATYGDEYFVAIPAQFSTNGTSPLYPLPDGVTSFTNGLTNQPGYIAPPIYKLMRVDMGPTLGPNGWVTVNKFMFNERNKFFYPNTNSTLYGVFNMSYRILGNNIEFIPLQSANQPVRLWYVPRMTMLLQENDITNASVSGWVEYVIVDAAIKAMQKEESDCSLLMAQKEALKRRIEAMAVNRDSGQPDRITDSRSASWGGNDGALGNGYKGGF